MNTVTVTKINGVADFEPIKSKFTIRGRRKGLKARPIKCWACEGKIEIGEQYFRINDEKEKLYGFYCLGCVEYS